MITKLRIVDHGLKRTIEKLTYPRVRVEMDPDDPNLKIENLDIVDDKCSLTELAQSIGEIICYILRTGKRL